MGSACAFRIANTIHAHIPSEELRKRPGQWTGMWRTGLSIISLERSVTAVGATVHCAQWLRPTRV